MSKTGVSQKQRWQQAVSRPKPLIDVRGSKQRTTRAKQYPEEVRIKAEIAAAVSARRSLEHTDDSHRWRLENVETERYRMRKSRERNNKQMNGRSNSHTRPPQWFGLAASESEADEQSSSSESELDERISFLERNMLRFSTPSSRQRLNQSGELQWDARAGERSRKQRREEDTPLWKILGRKRSHMISPSPHAKHVSSSGVHFGPARSDNNGGAEMRPRPATAPSVKRGLFDSRLQSAPAQSLLRSDSWRAGGGQELSVNGRPSEHPWPRSQKTSHSPHAEARHGYGRGGWEREEGGGGEETESSDSEGSVPEGGAWRAATVGANRRTGNGGSDVGTVGRALSRAEATATGAEATGRAARGVLWNERPGSGSHVSGSLGPGHWQPGPRVTGRPESPIDELVERMVSLEGTMRGLAASVQVARADRPPGPASGHFANFASAGHGHGHGHGHGLAQARRVQGGGGNLKSWEAREERARRMPVQHPTWATSGRSPAHVGRHVAANVQPQVLVASPPSSDSDSDGGPHWQLPPRSLLSLSLDPASLSRGRESRRAPAAAASQLELQPEAGPWASRPSSGSATGTGRSIGLQCSPISFFQPEPPRSSHPPPSLAPRSSRSATPLTRASRERERAREQRSAGTWTWTAAEEEEKEEKEENGEVVDTSMRDIISNLQLLAQKAAAVELHLTGGRHSAGSSSVSRLQRKSKKPFQNQFQSNGVPQKRTKTLRKRASHASAGRASTRTAERARAQDRAMPVSLVRVRRTPSVPVEFRRFGDSRLGVTGSAGGHSGRGSRSNGQRSPAGQAAQTRSRKGGSSVGARAGKKGLRAARGGGSGLGARGAQREQGREFSALSTRVWHP